MIGPYLSVELSEKAFFDARVAWGRSNNSLLEEVDGTLFYSDFITERWLAHARLSGVWRFDNWRITPSTELMYMQEKIQDFSVDNSSDFPIEISGEIMALGRLEMGSELGYEFVYNDAIVEPFVAGSFAWDLDSMTDLISDDIFSFQRNTNVELEAGILLHGRSGANLKLSGKYDGIGIDDAHAYGVQVWLSVPFAP
jgi:chitinase